jgi:hypothetical protein
MAKAHGSPFEKKLDEIRSRLLAEPSTDDMGTLRLHMDLLEQWDRLSLAMADAHDHDHMDDHDHVPNMFARPGVVVERQT